MKFLKINNQRAVRTGKIDMVAVTGREGDVQLDVYVDGIQLTYKRFREFGPAERAMNDLITLIENLEDR